MFRQIVVAFILVSINVSIHATGMVELMNWLVSKQAKFEKKFGTFENIFLFIEIFAIILSLHLLQICVWAGFYTIWADLKDFESALYFSITTYATIGYGDMVLPADWRLLGTIEGITGVLTFGWSTGVIFAVANRVFAIRIAQKKSRRRPS